MTGCKNNLKRMLAQKMVSFNSCCNVACLKFIFSCDKTTGYLSSIHFFEGRNANSIKRMNSAFYKVQWRHFSVVMDRFKITYVEFLVITFTNNYSNRFIFDGVIRKIKMWPIWGPISRMM